MTWYAAHIIMYLKYLDKEQDEYFVHENIVLLQAADNEEAFEEAKKIGASYEVDTTVGINEQPAKWTFAGVRILIECQNIDADAPSQNEDFKPTHRTEITYIPLIVSSKQELDKLAMGEMVTVTLDNVTPLSQDEVAEYLSQYSDS